MDDYVLKIVIVRHDEEVFESRDFCPTSAALIQILLGTAGSIAAGDIALDEEA